MSPPQLTPDTQSHIQQPVQPAPLTIPINTKGVKIPNLSPTSHLPSARNTLMDTAAFSPVNEKGCFEFDRVIRSGEVLKKGRKTKNYKPNHLVLRLLNLSIYADKEHTAIRHSIPLHDITAVARRRKSRRPRPGLFTVFTAPRNYHFDAKDETTANEWIDLLRTYARIDEFDSGLGTSEEETDAAEETTPTVPQKIPGVRSASASKPLQGPYGASIGSFSSISSLGAANFPGSSVSLAGPVQPPEGHQKLDTIRSASMTEMDQERVLRNGNLYLLKSKGGVKKWKPVWAVLRPKSLAIYPSTAEYSPLLIIPFPSLVNAVEIDSPSRNKKRQFCMQIITEERNWRFCAQDEDDLARWLGTIKSMLAKRRAADEAAVTAVGNPS